VSAAPMDQASPRALPTGVFVVAAALAGIGTAIFLWGLISDPATAWRSFHVNYLFWGTLAQGGVVLACALVIVDASWAGPVRRIAESLGAWVPVTLLLALLELAGRQYIYPWIDKPLPWKAHWLNTPRVFGTDLGIFLVLTLLTIAFLRASLRPALKAGEDGAQGFARSMIGRWTAGWRGDAEEREASARRLRVLAPVICLVYAFGYSMIAFDQVMSLSPTWYSNLFGVFFAWGGFLSAVSLTAVLSVLHRRYPGYEGEITPKRLHDLGKMIFAFSIFWMYLFFSQYLVIWYGNVPEETSFLQARLGTEFLQSTWYFQGWADRIFHQPWVVISLFAWICIWVIPFWFLLGARPKRTWWFLGSVATISVIGFWVERNVLIWPSLVPKDSWAFLGLIQVGTAAAFLGLFIIVYLVFTRIFPSLAVPRRS
jgi:hypothetical protein